MFMCWLFVRCCRLFVMMSLLVLSVLCMKVFGLFDDGFELILSVFSWCFLRMWVVLFGLLSGVVM